MKQRLRPKVVKPKTASKGEVRNGQASQPDKPEAQPKLRPN